MPLVIRPITAKRDIGTFVHFPWRVYRGNRAWVPPLVGEQKKLIDRDINPFFQHAEMQLFLAERDGAVVGRIAATVDHMYVEYHEEKLGYFGFFECFDDEEAARALFAAAIEWLATRGMEAIRGPYNPGTGDTLGVLLDAYDQLPAFLMPYNPQYYPRLIEAAGMNKAKDLLALYMHSAETPVSEKVQRVADIVRKRNNVEVRAADPSRFRDELAIIKLIRNDGWDRNWGFVPWTDAEIDYIAKNLVRVVDPELALFAFVDGEPAGFSIAVPDYNLVFRYLNGRLFPFGAIKLFLLRRRINRLRVMVTGIRTRYRNSGIDAAFYFETYRRGVRRGYLSGEFSWVLEDNFAMRNTLENMGARIYKHYRLYQKPLTAPA